jgi:hypothetical protein
MDRLYDGDIQADVDCLSDMSYDERLTVLQFNGYGQTIMNELITRMNIDPDLLQPAVNPVEQILSSIYEEDRSRILHVGGGIIQNRTVVCHAATPLHVACYFSDIKTIRCIIESCEAKVFDLMSAQTEDGSTPLFVAASHSTADCLACFTERIEAKMVVAALKIPNRNNQTPLHAAAQNSRDPKLFKYLSEFLRKYPGNLCAPDMYGH